MNSKLAKFFNLLLFAIAFIGNGALSQNLNPSELDFNRVAQKLAPSQLDQLPLSHTGFIWNKGDNKTDAWRPQGIAGISKWGKKILIVSWYGRKQANYQNRGARVSFVDVTDMNDIRYRHVLLVDANDETFPEMHAGGLVYRHGQLHVPDTRSGKKIVRVFDVSQIYKVPRSRRQEFFNYGYVLRESSNYPVSVKPSFMSFDWDRNEVLVGSFGQCTNQHTDTSECRGMSKNQLSWYVIGSPSNARRICPPPFSEMQGAGSENGRNGERVLYVASSYGASNPSHLHIAMLNSAGCSGGRSSIDTYKTIVYPPGLEDIHLSQSSGNLWTLTEFGPHEGSNNDRVVFAVKRRLLFP